MSDVPCSLLTSMYMHLFGSIYAQFQRCTVAPRGFRPKRSGSQPAIEQGELVVTNSHNTTLTEFIEASGVRYVYRRFGATKRTRVVFLQHFRGGPWDPKVTDGLAKHRPVILFSNAGDATSEGELADTVSGMAKDVFTFIPRSGCGYAHDQTAIVAAGAWPASAAIPRASVGT